jgi:hypothetical protein
LREPCSTPVGGFDRSFELEPTSVGATPELMSRMVDWVARRDDEGWNGERQVATA